MYPDSKEAKGVLLVSIRVRHHVFDETKTTVADDLHVVSFLAYTYRFSVPHDRLFLDALERDLKREKDGVPPTTEVIGEPARSFK